MSKQSAPNPAREAARELARRIGKMTDDQRRAMAPSMPIVSIEGRTLSPVNMLLVASQNAAATIVGGFRQWIKAGRCVRKGEKGLWIWVPTTVKGTVNWMTGQRDDEAEEVRFIMAPVFDVSQTDEIGAEADQAAA